MNNILTVNETISRLNDMDTYNRTENDYEQYALKISKTILQLIKEYTLIHPYAILGGGEYIMQDDDAQVDALELVCDIFEKVNFKEI